MLRGLNLSCQACGAQLVVEEAQRAALCPYCASTSVVSRPETVDRPAPRFALRFSLSEVAAQRRAKAWLESRSLFADSRFKRAAVEGLQGVYLPAYLYSAACESDFRALIGEDYEETETSRATEGGQAVTRTRTVTRTEWVPLEGKHAEYVADVLVTSSRGLPNDELERVEPFDVGLLCRYSPALVTGRIAEEPSMTREECLALAGREARERTREHLEAFLPGDHQRELQLETRLTSEALELCLVPLYVGAVRHTEGAAPVRLVVNGQSGAVYARVPLSWVKITAAVLAGLALVGALVAALWRGGAL